MNSLPKNLHSGWCSRDDVTFSLYLQQKNNSPEVIVSQAIVSCIKLSLALYVYSLRRYSPGEFHLVSKPSGNWWAMPL